MTLIKRCIECNENTEISPKNEFVLNVTAKKIEVSREI